MRVDLKIVLFGSQLAGSASCDSDFDVFLSGEEFAARVVPQPLPHDQPEFYSATFDALEHHQAKRAWSLELWNRLGGKAGIQRLQELAAANLLDRHPSVTASKIDLFLHLPASISRAAYGVQLQWNDVHARFDFAYDALRKQLGNSAELQEFANGLLAALPSRQQQAIALEKRLAELSGSAAPETWQQYASLSLIHI